MRDPHLLWKMKLKLMVILPFLTFPVERGGDQEEERVPEALGILQITTDTVRGALHQV